MSRISELRWAIRTNRIRLLTAVAWGQGSLGDGEWVMPAMSRETSDELMRAAEAGRRRP